MYKVEAIKSIDVPTKVHNIRRFVGIVNSYRDIRSKHTHTLARLVKLCPMKVKFKWTDIQNYTFIAMKKIVGRNVLLSYPNFSEIFTIHTDASKTQIRGVIGKNG